MEGLTRKLRTLVSSSKGIQEVGVEREVAKLCLEISLLWPVHKACFCMFGEESGSTYKALPALDIGALVQSIFFNIKNFSGLGQSPKFVTLEVCGPKERRSVDVCNVL